MFCPTCGNEIPENTKFCGFCGSGIEVATTSQEASSVSGTSIEKVKSETTNDFEERVSFLNGLEDPIGQVPHASSGENELLDKLVRFRNLFHAYMHNIKVLLTWTEREKELKKAGSDWYYNNVDDSIINASKQIDSELASAKSSLKKAEASIKENEEERRAAQARFDAVRSKSMETTTKTEKKTKSYIKQLYIFLAIYVVFAIFVMRETGFNFSRDAATLVLYIGLPIALIVYYKNKQNRVNKDQSKTMDAAQSSLDKKYKDIVKKDKELTAKIAELNASIKEMTPVAGKIKHDALERARYYYESDLYALQNGMQEAAEFAQDQYREMKDSKTLASENDWGQIDELVMFVESGRADTLKEALQLLDTSKYREANLAMQQDISEGLKISARIQAEGFAQQFRMQGETIASLQSGFEALEAQSNIQHAEQVALQASQIAQQSQMVSSQAKMAELAGQQLGETRGFNQEVRDRMNWTDENRPTQWDVQRNRFENPVIGKGRRS